MPFCLINQSRHRPLTPPLTEAAFCSHSVLKELTEVLGREKLRPYLVPEERAQFIIALLKKSLFIDINETIRVCRDPEDDKILELAVNGRRVCIITGDKDLLALNPFRKISIIKPDEFLTSITSNNQVQQ